MLPALCTSATKHFVLSAQILDFPGQSGILIDIPTDQSSMVLISQGFQTFQKGTVPTFMDSGASNMMFVSREAFTEYKSIIPHMGDSVKAENGSFEIVGEGNVVQKYQVNGKERNMTYTCALHAPTLSANLVSVSAFDKAGLIMTFGNGKGITQRADGTIVLVSQNVNRMYILEAIDNRMYILEAIDNIPDVPLAMASLSRPTLLEQ